MNLALLFCSACVAAVWRVSARALDGLASTHHSRLCSCMPALRIFAAWLFEARDVAGFETLQGEAGCAAW